MVRDPDNFAICVPMTVADYLIGGLCALFIGSLFGGWL